MAHVIPFRGLHYRTEKVGALADVVTPPYDIISPEQQAHFYEKHANNVIRLEYGVQHDSDNESENRYTRAAAFLNSWLREGVLAFEPEPCLYLYEQQFCHAGQAMTYRGFIGLVELEEFSKGVVLPHEETLSKAKSDRFDLMCATDCNFSQIYCLYLDEQRQVRAVMDQITQRAADISFTTEDGIQQAVWTVREADLIGRVQTLFADKQLFIADGHHRYETALAYRNKLRQENPDSRGDELFNYVMMMLVDMDDPGLVVFPTHRLVSGLARFDEPHIISVLKDDFCIDKIIVDRDTTALCDIMEKDLIAFREGVFGLYFGEDYYYRLRLSNPAIIDNYLPDKSDAYRSLDVSILHMLVLDKVLGIDMENMANQKNLTYTRDPREALEGVRQGAYQCAFILNATKVHQIKDVSLAGEKMPQKSTYFYPKLVTGIVMNKFR